MIGSQGLGGGDEQGKRGKGGPTSTYVDSRIRREDATAALKVASKAKDGADARVASAAAEREARRIYKAASAGTPAERQAALAAAAEQHPELKPWAEDAAKSNWGSPSDDRFQAGDKAALARLEEALVDSARASGQVEQEKVNRDTAAVAEENAKHDLVKKGGGEAALTQAEEQYQRERARRDAREKKNKTSVVAALRAIEAERKAVQKDRKSDAKLDVKMRSRSSAKDYATWRAAQDKSEAAADYWRKDKLSHDAKELKDLNTKEKESGLTAEERVRKRALQLSDSQRREEARQIEARERARKRRAKKASIAAVSALKKETADVVALAKKLGGEAKASGSPEKRAGAIEKWATAWRGLKEKFQKEHGARYEELKSKYMPPTDPAAIANRRENPEEAKEFDALRELWTAIVKNEPPEPPKPPDPAPGGPGGDAPPAAPADSCSDCSCTPACLPWQTCKCTPRLTFPSLELISPIPDGTVPTPDPDPIPPTQPDPDQPEGGGGGGAKKPGEDFGLGREVTPVAPPGTVPTVPKPKRDPDPEDPEDRTGADSRREPEQPPGQSPKQPDPELPCGQATVIPRNMPPVSLEFRAGQWMFVYKGNAYAFTGGSAYTAATRIGDAVKSASVPAGGKSKGGGEAGPTIVDISGLAVECVSFDSGFISILKDIAEAMGEAASHIGSAVEFIARAAFEGPMTDLIAKYIAYVQGNGPPPTLADVAWALVDVAMFVGPGAVIRGAKSAAKAAKSLIAMEKTLVKAAGRVGASITEKEASGLLRGALKKVVAEFADDAGEATLKYAGKAAAKMLRDAAVVLAIRETLQLFDNHVGTLLPDGFRDVARIVVSVGAGYGASRVLGAVTRTVLTAEPLAARPTRPRTPPPPVPPKVPPEGPRNVKPGGLAVTGERVATKPPRPEVEPALGTSSAPPPRGPAKATPTDGVGHGPDATSQRTPDAHAEAGRRPEPSGPSAVPEGTVASASGDVPARSGGKPEDPSAVGPRPGVDSPLDGRPTYRESTLRSIWDDTDIRVSPTGAVEVWDKIGAKWTSDYQLGHTPGHEWRYIVEKAKSRVPPMTRSELLDWVNAHPEWVVPQDRLDNLRHAHEASAPAPDLVPPGTQ